MTQARAGPERRDNNRAGRLRGDLAGVLLRRDQPQEPDWTLIYNIEQIGRYRVFEVRWQLQDDRKNTEPPFNLINKPSIKVGYREPLTKSNP